MLPGRQYVAQVTASFATGSFKSPPSFFLTLMARKTLENLSPVWHSNSSAAYVLLRRTLSRPQPSASSFLTISARPTLNTIEKHGVNTSSLLCAYKLWLDGVPLGVGPGRRIGGSVNADTYNLTDLLLAATVDAPVLSIESFYGAVAGEPGGVLAVVHDGAGTVDGSEWQAFDATAAFSPSLGKAGFGEGSGNYRLPFEQI